MRKVPIAIVFIFMWAVTWMGSLAYWQGKYPTIAERDYRQDLGFSMVMSLNPLCWIIMPFYSGFYEYGFQVFPKTDVHAFSPTVRIA